MIKLKKYHRDLIFVSFVLVSLFSFYFIIFILLQAEIVDLLFDWTFLAAIISYILILEELLRWAINGKRSELSDIVAIFFFFFLILFFTKDLLTSIMGAFSIYLWFGIYELKDYPVLNKVLIISLVTYNVIFISGIISTYLGDPFLLNTAFAFSFWIILILGFILFGRKYIVIWRFMSPEYLTLFLYIIAWLAVTFIDQYTPFKFILYGPLSIDNFNLRDFFFNIYFILILVNWLVYLISGTLLDKMLGIKRIKDQNLIELVNDIKNKLKIKGDIKVGFGKYPILNAMAYGSVFDKRIALIAEDYQEIPEDEMKGIVAHELAHTKGKHTLILASITSIDLVVRMLLGIPATFYDYTFGSPELPLLGFILLNFGIYIFLYIIVRILESKADLNAKRAGYSLELTKALYNLESFYATGREIGLNTMLLCEEKINLDNKMMNYIETAQYLHNSMIKPSRASLLGNIINSHPPTYHRIASLLDNKLTPTNEAILPFLLMSNKKIRKYATLFENSNESFQKIANEKFKEMFNISSISEYLHSLKRKEIYNYDLNNTYIFKNKISGEYLVADLLDVKLNDDISSPDTFIVLEYKTLKESHLHASEFTKKRVKIDGAYNLRNQEVTILKDVLVNKRKNKVKLIFNNSKQQSNGFKKKIKLPLSIDFISDFKNKDVFIKEKGRIIIMRCTDVLSSTSIENYKLILKNLTDGKEYEYPLNQLIIKPQDIFLPISQGKAFRKAEYNVINWLKLTSIRTYFSLKKPVNNIEIGYITEVKINQERSPDEGSGEYIIIIRNIFEKEIKIPLKIIDHISFQYKTALIQRKNEMSIITKLGYKLIKKFKPENIFYLNKV
ncbi:MAG: hypothetical protein EU532_14700 [Promethearchaeota archaeon]|nr:MAG: hypothetical protein EU532_14700 [Candidatus Lokiarchaeota archaeon]